MNEELITTGSVDLTKTVPEEVIMGAEPQEQTIKVLDFEKIKETAKRARKASYVVEEKLTPEEEEDIPKYVDHLSGLIEEYAVAGKDSIQYNCSMLPRHMMEAIAQGFRDLHPRGFMVIVDGGRGWIIVEWSGNNEV